MLLLELLGGEVSFAVSHRFLNKASAAERHLAQQDSPLEDSTSSRSDDCTGLSIASRGLPSRLHLVSGKDGLREPVSRLRSRNESITLDPEQLEKCLCVE